jgi:hypothetical protein
MKDFIRSACADLQSVFAGTKKYFTVPEQPRVRSSCT